MKSITLTRLLLLGVLFISNSCKRGVTEQRPLEPTLLLPDVTLEVNRLEQWTGDKPLWNSVRAWHYNPEMVQPLWDVWEAFTKPPLSLRMKILIGAVVDSRNHCPYCLSSAVCFLIKEGVSEDIILGLQTDIAKSAFSEKEKALLLLAERITVNPSSAHVRVAPALEAGWTEAEVAQAVFVASYFNMLNRISEAFALPPDEDHPFDPAPVFPILTCEDFKK
jgi:alkylhydroperoxidase family enzyme